MDDIIWFPVTDQGKKRFEHICAITGQSREEWFKWALRESERKATSERKTTTAVQKIFPADGLPDMMLNKATAPRPVRKL
ncbi:Hypothetical protein DEACI_4045 [Acididesulfobacillus acetoxydans]|uniref:Uncharacterized protein n=1 Tax=Acididesulfobacillus acetoxydans TaxID=1561005 RepID=A0A8S0WIB1_9FIRM|nr:hypothetical protein [Acididesulfobacillus acetoxydans]CAA7603222.1 Hypothetical protein DEACI_4045 [Acididesulfobacillus acetoxydans]